MERSHAVGLITPVARFYALQNESAIATFFQLTDTARAGGWRRRSQNAGRRCEIFWRPRRLLSATPFPLTLRSVEMFTE